MTRNTETIRKLARDYVESHEETLAAFRNDAGEIQYRPIEEDSRKRDVVNAFMTAVEIEWMIDYVQDQDAPIEELPSDLNEIKVENERLSEVLGTELERVLRERFDHHYQLYPRDVCTVFEFEPIPNETPNTIDRRDTLQFLFEKLTIDDPEIKEGIRVLDDSLKCKYEFNADLVKELDLERSYTPDHYWWRHPEKVLRED